MGGPAQLDFEAVAVAQMMGLFDPQEQDFADLAFHGSFMQGLWGSLTHTNIRNKLLLRYHDILHTHIHI